MSRLSAALRPLVFLPVLAILLAIYLSADDQVEARAIGTVGGDTSSSLMLTAAGSSLVPTLGSGALSEDEALLLSGYGGGGKKKKKKKKYGKYRQTLLLKLIKL